MILCVYILSKLNVLHSFVKIIFYAKFHSMAFCILKERLPYYGSTASLLDSLSMAGSFDFVLLLYHPSFGMIHMNFFDLCLTWLYFRMLFIARAPTHMFVGCNPQNVVDGRLGLHRFIGYKHTPHMSCSFFCSLLCVCRHCQSKDIFWKALFSYLSHDVWFGCFQIVDGSESSCLSDWPYSLFVDMVE